MSTEIIARWEMQNNSSCVAKKHKSEVLRQLVRQCGFSTNLSVTKLRVLLASLSKHQVPSCSDQVDHMLKERGESVCGPGRNSKQQRKMILLGLLDPSLKVKMGTNKVKTGNFKWRKEFADEILPAVVQYLEKWVNKPDELPFNYDTTTSDLWVRRRKAGFEWVKSHPGRTYIKEVYKTYALDFKAVIKGCERNTFGKALEKIYFKKHDKEKGHLRQLATMIMHPLYSSCICTEDNVFDIFSFIFNNLFSAVFIFFQSKVGNAPVIDLPPRKKDREDDAKTYYICGVVLKSLMNAVTSKTSDLPSGVDPLSIKSKKMLAALKSLTVSTKVAAKLGLPTRHVTIKNRGGLLFASQAYYELMSKIEDMFYSTIMMRDNFALARPDAILNIKKKLLVNESLHGQFQKIIMADEECVDNLWQLLVHRISNLHGTEAASQLMSELVASQRKNNSAKKVVPEQRTVAVKYEQLRAARKRKKMERHIDVDLTMMSDVDLAEAIDQQTDDTRDEREDQRTDSVREELTHYIGEQVTAMEGRGSACKLWEGIVVEIDRTSERYIICCSNVPNYPKGYLMKVPFIDAINRINRPIHTSKRKRKRKIIPDM